MKTKIAIVVAVTFLSYLIILIFFLQRHNFSPGALIHVGSKFTENAYIVPDIPVNNEYGYDGQFYYRLALEPFYMDSSLGPVLDAPAYRMQRIFYPVLVHVLSLGKSNLVPVNLIIVNILFIIIIAFTGGKLADAAGLSPYWGFTFSLYPGFVFSLIVDTPEPVFTGLLLLSLMAIRFQKHFMTTLFLTAAVLTRETTFIAIVSILFAFLIQIFFEDLEPNYKLKWHNAIIPLAVFILWQTIIYYRWGHPAFSEGLGNLGIPFAGFFNAFSNFIKSTTNFALFDALLLSGYLISGAVALILLSSSKALFHEKIIFLSYALFATLFSAPIYEYRGGFLRVFSEFYASGMLIILNSHQKFAKILFLYWIFLFFITAGGYSFIH